MAVPKTSEQGVNAASSMTRREMSTAISKCGIGCVPPGKHSVSRAARTSRSKPDKNKTKNKAPK